MATISLCMIVKNEEPVLGRCLDSIAGLMDEIIIVDTGSVDRTKEIAAAYTDKIYDYTWQDDFAAARNFSFSKATKEYIYVADADEWIDEENRERFLKLKQVLLPEIEIIQMKYCNQLEHGSTYNFDAEYRGKLFKRVRTFQWMDPVHETVNTAPIIYNSEIEIRHMPGESHAARDFSLIRKAVAKGERISGKLHGLYARELYISGGEQDFLDAEAYFKGAIEEEGRSLDEIKEAACVLARVYRLKEDTVHFFQYCLKDTVSEATSEICCELGDFFLQHGEIGEAAMWYYNAAYETTSMLNIHYMGDYPLKRLVECYEKLGDEEQAGLYRTRLSEWEIPPINFEQGIQ